MLSQAKDQLLRFRKIKKQDKDYKEAEYYYTGRIGDDLLDDLAVTFLMLPFAEQKIRDRKYKVF